MQKDTHLKIMLSKDVPCIFFLLPKGHKKIYPEYVLLCLNVDY